MNKPVEFKWWERLLYSKKKKEAIIKREEELKENRRKHQESLERLKKIEKEAKEDLEWFDKFNKSLKYNVMHPEIKKGLEESLIDAYNKAEGLSQEKSMKSVEALIKIWEKLL